MLIQQNHSENKGSFFVEEENKILAEMTYSLATPQLMLIDHTEVLEEVRGRNMGYQLVKSAVVFARKNQVKILPICPFAKSVFEKKKEELGDVLHGK